jgi:HlyD family secretion protein
MFLAVLAVLGLAGGAGGWYWHVSSKPHTEYRTNKITRGDMLATISATGTIEPEEVVDIGAQVAGQIVSFGNGTDNKPVDYRSAVAANSVLARIDETTYKADVDTAKAQLEQGKANAQKAGADKDQAVAKLYQAQRNWERAEKIGPSDALSQNDYDMYRADFLTAQANVSVAEAEIVQAKASILQAQATLDKAQRNLDFCTITSPVDGVIIERRVNVGQTVVSSLNTPSLFLIAKDLNKMQIWVAVNEADIGHIYSGQNVTFTCDAFQGQVFKGIVNKVRLYATMTQNVVTYTVEVNCDNPEGKLLPYLTANVQFEIERDPNVLMVPNSALRWYPSDVDEVAADARSQWKPIESDDQDKPALVEVPKAEKKRGKKDKVLPKKAPERHGTIWVTEGSYVRPFAVTIGTSDGINTKVSGAGVKEGEDVVVGEVVQSAEDSQERNPFLPQIRHSH